MIAVIICLTLSLYLPPPQNPTPTFAVVEWSRNIYHEWWRTISRQTWAAARKFFFEWNAIRNKTLKRCAHTQTSHVQKYYSYGWRNIKWIEMWIRKRRWWVVPSWYERFSPLPIETQMPVEVTGARIETKFISRFRTNFWGVTSQTKKLERNSLQCYQIMQTRIFFFLRVCCVMQTFVWRLLKQAIITL